MFELYEPHKPLSAAITTMATAPTGRTSSRGWLNSVTLGANVPTSSAMVSAYGLPRCTRSCTRRSLAAATIFIACVICEMFFTTRILRRLSRIDAISSAHLCACYGFGSRSPVEVGLEFSQRRLQRFFVVLGDL